MTSNPGMNEPALRLGRVANLTLAPDVHPLSHAPAEARRISTYLQPNEAPRQFAAAPQGEGRDAAVGWAAAPWSRQAAGVAASKRVVSDPTSATSEPSVPWATKTPFAITGEPISGSWVGIVHPSMK